jgi:ribonuclease P/MRP protein subunit POP1
MWQPLPEPIDPKGKGKELSATAPIPESQRNTGRVVWLRFHPVSHAQALSALQAAASQYLSKKKADGYEGIKIQIVDLKDQINVFEIMGPQASQVIRGALATVPGDQRDDFKKVRQFIMDTKMVSNPW